MKLLKALETGACGVMFGMPDGVVVRESEHAHLSFVDEAKGLVWQVLFGDLALDLGATHDPLLQRDADAAARVIYAFTERALDATSGSKGGRRSDDTVWSPLVSCVRTTVGGGATLQVVHRTAYRPGCEIMMGHLLVPTAYGLVEFRILARDATTGMRESIALVHAQKEGRVAVGGFLTQAEYDAPTYDVAFPHHCLSRVRAALATLAEPGRLEVVRPPIARAAGAMTLPSFGASFTPPPRFALAGDDARDTLLFTRVSLANTDGVWRMAVAREDPDAIAARRPLRQRVESLLARRFGIEHIDDARVTLTHTDDGAARVHLRFDAREAQCALASTWWLHSDQGLRGVQVSAPTGGSLADAVAVVDEAVASWRVGMLD